MPKSTPLSDEVAKVAARVRKATKGKINEQNTKASMIEPVLRALGWDTEDVDEVVREFRHRPKDPPVDYGLLVNREPKLFVEAKAFGENLGDQRWANQIMGYASVAGVEWIVLTNGDEYRIYNALAKVHVEKKLFRECRLSTDAASAAETLTLLAKDQLDENRIDVLWKAHFVDRQVREALTELFDGEHDMAIVNAVMKRTRDIDADEVRASLRRCNAHFEFPQSTVEELARSAKRAKKDAGGKRSATGGERKAPVFTNVSVKDLIDAGVIRAPLALFRRFKGHDFTARIEADGSVTYQGKRYDSLSTAASEARVTVIGPRADGSLPATNGWSFWMYRASDGSEQEIDHARQALVRSRDRTVGAG
jgi:predicted type IV restriction endonuclease